MQILQSCRYAALALLLLTLGGVLTCRPPNFSSLAKVVQENNLGVEEEFLQFNG